MPEAINMRNMAKLKIYSLCASTRSCKMKFNFNVFTKILAKDTLATKFKIQRWCFMLQNLKAADTLATKFKIQRWCFTLQNLKAELIFAYKHCTKDDVFH